MATATERIVVQVPQQKANIAGTAKQLGLNISDFELKRLPE